MFHSPVCSLVIAEADINAHLDRNCADITRPSRGGPASQSAGGLAPIFMAKDKNLPPAGRMVDSRKRSAPGPSPTSLAKRNKISNNLQAAAPLAERLRPSKLAEFIGQTHLIDPTSALMQSISRGSVGSIILWGPPGYMPCPNLSSISI